MKYFFAPLEGITYYNFRQVHHQFYPGIDEYYTPFVVATWTHKMKSREKRDILPENNAGVPVVPQILTNKADEFRWCARYMADFGYTEVNLNAGCPVGTVTSKGKGAGLLRDPDQLDAFLDDVFNGLEREKITVSAPGSSHPALLTVSVKTRLGWEDPAEFEKILSVYQRYPISMLIIHARTRKELYGGEPEMKAFARAYETIKGNDPQNRSSAPLHETGNRCAMKLCYNGNILTPEDAVRIGQQFPKLDAIMIGRGLLQDPGLVMKIRGWENGCNGISENHSGTNEHLYDRPDMIIPVSEGHQTGYHGDSPTDRKKEIQRIHDFHDALYYRYEGQFHDDRILVDHMKELWTYLGKSFPGCERDVKAIHKARNRAEYEAAVRILFNYATDISDLR